MKRGRSEETTGVIPTLSCMSCRLFVPNGNRDDGPVAVGAGIFSSSWFKVPTAQAMSLPGNWTDVEGTGWRTQPRDLTFLAYSAFVGFGF